MLIDLLIFGCALRRIFYLWPFRGVTKGPTNGKQQTHTHSGRGGWRCRKCLALRGIEGAEPQLLGTDIGEVIWNV